MYGYTIQDWITIRGNSTITSITQGEQAWMGFAPFEDIVFWLDCREITLGGGSSLVINYETSPTKDDVLFASMAGAITVVASSSTPTITKVLLSQNPTVPLARWVRWRLSVVGSPTTAWDATFRILCAANAVSMGASG